MRGPLAAALAGALAVSAAPAALAAPGKLVLPLREEAVYARTVGGKTEELSLKLRFVPGTGQYELVTSSPGEEGLFRLDPETLFATYAETRSRGDRASVRRIEEIVPTGPPKEGELLVAGREAMSMSFRAFPWGTRSKIALVFAGTEGASAIRFELAVAGKERIRAAGSEIECWKAEVGASGILGGLFGKAAFWYSVAPPHYLVKAESPAGPGSPASTTILLRYAAEPR